LRATLNSFPRIYILRAVGSFHKFP
jgi:hypothetical protein